MKSYNISFLVAAHNEEKIIGTTLKNLASLPHKNYEVLIGLDGCTDNTEKIVKDFCLNNERFKFFILNFRSGKAAVVNYLIKKSCGEIIFINDADWLFRVKSRDSLTKLLSVFNDKNIGGIADSFPIEWDNKKLNKSNLLYKVVAYSSFYWLEFQKSKFSYFDGNKFVVKKPTMFMTNIFRRSLYKENKSLADDFERTREIIKRNHKVILFNDSSIPRMIYIYDKVLFNDLFKQKIRTAMARETNQ